MTRVQTLVREKSRPAHIQQLLEYLLENLDDRRGFHLDQVDNFTLRIWIDEANWIVDLTSQDWRHQIRDLADWARYHIDDGDTPQRVGVSQAEMLEEVARAIRKCIAERSPTLKDELRLHTPQWINKKEGWINGHAECSCGAAVADGVHVYSDIWADHIADVVSRYNASK